MRSFILVLAWGSLAAAAPAPAPRVEFAAAKRLLPGAAACESTECLIEHAYASDAKASELSLQLWRDTGDVAGLGAEEVLNGGFRGKIRLVPQLPLKAYRKHLEWLVAASQTLDHFFDALFKDAPPPNYRWHGLEFRFVKSVGKHRPSAYALGWAVAYNVEGSLNISGAAVQGTLFHELFHANDEAHGEWSAAHLRSDYRAIFEKCGAKPTLKCLAPYAPTDTVVRGGTFYAFQQNNGDTVQEYAAEVAVRYFKEQSQMLAKGKLAQRSFKCGPPENARAWSALAAEFFGNRDLVPPC